MGPLSRAARLGKTVPNPDRGSMLDLRLSVRELEVLALVADGRTNQKIAEHLNIGIETVKTHMRHALAKLGAPTRAGAVATALRRGWIL